MLGKLRLNSTNYPVPTTGARVLWFVWGRGLKVMWTKSYAESTLVPRWAWWGPLQRASIVSTIIDTD